MKPLELSGLALEFFSGLKIRANTISGHYANPLSVIVQIKKHEELKTGLQDCLKLAGLDEEATQECYYSVFNADYFWL